MECCSKEIRAKDVNDPTRTQYTECAVASDYFNLSWQHIKIVLADFSAICLCNMVHPLAITTLHNNMKYNMF